MCGIAGFTHHTRSVGDSVIRRMASALTHRGPDQQGSYISSRLSLGAVRLQIFDLQRGEQPLRSDDCKTVIAYNGEIYNFREIRAELEQKGHVFRSDCDTEVALKAFLQWDTACFGRFRGMFAMAIWSERENRLVLARDRMGEKPLYYAQMSGALAFASELTALEKVPGLPLDLSREALWHYSRPATPGMLGDAKLGTNRGVAILRDRVKPAHLARAARTGSRPS